MSYISTISSSASFNVCFLCWLWLNNLTEADKSDNCTKLNSLLWYGFYGCNSFSMPTTLQSIKLCFFFTWHQQLWGHQMRQDSSIGDGQWSSIERGTLVPGDERLEYKWKGWNRCLALKEIHGCISRKEKEREGRGERKERRKM